MRFSATWADGWGRQKADGAPGHLLAVIRRFIAVAMLRMISPAVRQVIGVFLGLLAEIVVLQWLNHAYASGFGASPDEAAHFVSSVMVRDFLAHHQMVSPMRFAWDFYLHYPKVAIGNWPPLMYDLMGTWFLVTGVSRASALLFIAGAEALTGTLIFVVGRGLLSPLAGLFAAALYVALPLVQAYGDQVMTEQLVTLLIFTATWQFTRFTQCRTAWNALLFGGFASLAILTRGSAWCLAMVPPLVIVMCRDFRMILNWRLWLATLPVVVLCVPWYVATHGMAHGAMVGYGGNALAFFQAALLFFPGAIVASVGPVMLLLAAVGVIFVIRHGGQAEPWAAQAAMAWSVLAIHCLVPAAIEARYMMQLLPNVVLFAAAGAFWLIDAGLKRPGFWVALMVIIAATQVRLPDYTRNSGYGTVRKIVAAHAGKTGAGGVGPAVLVASDSIGEGSIISSFVMETPRPRTVVLRGSELLTREDWVGRGPKDLYPTPEALRGLLDDISVSFVVIDKAINPSFRRPYHARLLAMMASDHWRPIGGMDVERRGRIYPNAVLIFERATSGPASPNMHLVNDLMESRRR